AVGTAAGAVAQKIGGLRQEGRIGYASHKMLHAAFKHQAPIYQPMLEPRYVEPYPGWNMIMRRR
ncbi:MAG TPA: hypothetical protein PKX31_14205, partial [Chitinophagaceae bacterium]|nr:hypothetical protein [Chitinophagaceae bacterium]